MKLPNLALLLLGCIHITATAADSDYYKQEPQFHMWPDPTAARYKISHFGPTGIGLELRAPNFTMHVVNIQEGSPAAATELQKGQIIESVNGHTLKDEDPLVLLGNRITEAEANDGVMKLIVKDTPDAPAKEIILKIPALGTYSDTWPVNCPKSDQIVRNPDDALPHQNLFLTADSGNFGSELRKAIQPKNVGLVVKPRRST